jgi:PAP2 superfamily
MPRSWSLAALVCVMPLVCGSAVSASDAATDSDNEVVNWNKTLLTIVRTQNALPGTIHATRDFAILHAAIYDAVNAIDGRHEPYLIRVERVSPHASQKAAAASAAHEVLVELFPSFQTTLDQQLAESLAKLPDGVEKTEGVDLGQAVAQAVVTLRRDDGSAATPDQYVPGTAPGDYQPTPPNFQKQPNFFHWSKVTPFTLRQARQFRPGPPPKLTSAEYTKVFNEVKLVGIAIPNPTTEEQKEHAAIGTFWNGQIQNYWNEITQTAVLAHHLNTASSARVFALVNLALADSVIAFYDAKYTYNFWRPVTAIQKADTDNNPDTVADPNWTPQAGKTAADPSYPGAHATISRAAEFVLNSVFGRGPFHINVTSEAVPGAIRSFDSFAAIEQEASRSRVFAGQHFQSDEDAGERLGASVADFAVDHFLARVHRHGDHGGFGDRDDDGADVDD